MSQYRRLIVPGGVYFFTVVTNDRRPLFADHGLVDLLRQAFAEVMRRRPFTMDAAVVLPDHLHCLWRLPTGDGDFPGRWRAIKQRLSMEIETPINARGEKAVWQRRYWEHLIRDENDWRRHMDYIHYNPVKHGYVVTPADWPHSSFRKAVAQGWYEAGWGAAGEPAGLAGLDKE